MNPVTHRSIEPAILYLGTPVVLVSTLNEDGSANLSPMSSAWWLGWSCMLGFDASSKTVENLLRTGQCVLNLPAESLASAVNSLARTTGSCPMPAHKARMRYRHIADKFDLAGLTKSSAGTGFPPRVQECPIQLEAVLVSHRPFAADDARLLIPAVAIEVLVKSVYVDEQILSTEFENRIDPEKWKPLIMSFLQYFGLGQSVHSSRLREVPEEAWGGRKPIRL